MEYEKIYGIILHGAGHIGNFHHYQKQQMTQSQTLIVDVLGKSINSA